MTSSFDSAGRFSTRVADYRRARPGYPPAVVDLLARTCGWAPDRVVADIGSGTGLLARIFLERGGRVIGVEPDEAMRRAGEEELAPFGDRFVSVAGRAEATTLEPASVDLIAVGQAFHWFDVPASRREFLRVLRPSGCVALLWNDRRTTGALCEDYERLVLAYGCDYETIRRRHADPAGLRELFQGDDSGRAVFHHAQALDYPALRAHLLSASYAPQAGEPEYGEMLAELVRIFDAHQAEGRVRIEYETRVFYGTIGARPAVPRS
jgi:SAM-dependent methyltransferase